MAAFGLVRVFDVPACQSAASGLSRTRGASGALPWAEPHSRFTTLFERLAIDVLAACDVASAAKLLGISWDQAWHLMDRAVARGLAAKPLNVPARVGVDEKAAGKGQDYITVVSDLDAGTVEYIADERRQASLDGYFEKFTDEQLAGIEAVAMDMWEPFAASVRAHLSDADDKIVFDRYHLMAYLTKAIDTVRKQENRALLAAGDKSLARSEVPVAVLGREPSRPPPRPLRRPAGQRPQNRPRMGHQGEPTALLVLPAPRLGGQAFRPLVLLGHPFPAATDHRRGKDPQTPRSRTAVLLRTPDHQRRRRRPQLPHPGDQGLRPRLPQPRALQDRNLLPPRRITALPHTTMTNGLPGRANFSDHSSVIRRWIIFSTKIFRPKTTRVPSSRHCSPKWPGSPRSGDHWASHRQ